MSLTQPEDTDTTQPEQRQRRLRRISVVMGGFAAFTGMMALSRVASNPRFETIHTLDVIGLMTAGAGIAIGLLLLIQFFCLPGPRSLDKPAGRESK